MRTLKLLVLPLAAAALYSLATPPSERSDDDSVPCWAADTNEEPGQPRTACAASTPCPAQADQPSFGLAPEPRPLCPDRPAPRPRSLSPPAR